MLIIENEHTKIIEIWLTNEEKRSENIKDKIKAYKEPKYKVAIFISGEKDLCTTMENLIIKNKKYS